MPELPNFEALVPVSEGPNFDALVPLETPTTRPPGALPVEPAFSREIAATDVPLGTTGRFLKSGGALIGRGHGAETEFSEGGGLTGLALRSGPNAWVMRKVFGEGSPEAVSNVIGYVKQAPVKLVGALSKLAGGQGIKEAVTESVGEPATRYWGTVHEDVAKQQAKFDPGSYYFQLGEGAVSTIPSLITSPVGSLNLMAAAAGQQQFGNTLADATDAYEKQGMTRQQAMDKAAPWALLDGLQTALLTKIIPGGETAMANIFKKQGAEAAKNFGEQLIKNYFKNSVARMGARVAKEGALEGVEEAMNQALSGAISKWSYAPEKSWEQIWEETKLGGSLGIALGGLMGGAGIVLGGREQVQPEIPPPVQPEPETGPLPITPRTRNRIEPPVFESGQVPVPWMSGLVPRDTIFETPRIAPPDAPNTALEQVAEKLARGETLRGEDLNFVNRLNDGDRSRVIQMAENRLAALSEAAINAPPIAESYFQVPSQGGAMPVYPTFGETLPQPSTQPTEPYASTIRGGEKVVPKARLSGKKGKGDRGSRLEQAASRQPEPVAARAEGEAAPPQINVIRYNATNKAVTIPSGDIFALVRTVKKRGGGTAFEVTGYSKLKGKHSDLEGMYEARSEADAIDSAKKIAEREMASKPVEGEAEGVANELDAVPASVKPVFKSLPDFVQKRFLELRIQEQAVDDWISRNPPPDAGPRGSTIASPMSGQAESAAKIRWATRATWDAEVARLQKKAKDALDAFNQAVEVKGWEQIPDKALEKYAKRYLKNRPVSKSASTVQTETGIGNVQPIKIPNQPAVEPPERQVTQNEEKRQEGLQVEQPSGKLSAVSGAIPEPEKNRTKAEVLGSTAPEAVSISPVEKRLRQVIGDGATDALIEARAAWKIEKDYEYRGLERLRDTVALGLNNTFSFKYAGTSVKVATDLIEGRKTLLDKLINLEPIKESEIDNLGTYPSVITRFGYERGDKKIYTYEGKLKPAVEAPWAGSASLPPQTPTQLPPVVSTPKSRLPSGRRTGKLPPALKKEAATPEPVKQKQGFDTKAAKEQKRYLLEEVDKAIADAPETSPKEAVKAMAESPEMVDVRLRDKWFNDNPSPKPFETYSIPYSENREKIIEEGQAKYESELKAWQDRIETELDQPLRQKYGLENARGLDLENELKRRAERQYLTHVRIEVPGDGIFTIINTKPALKAFKEKAQRFPTSSPKQSFPSKPRLTPTTVPPTGKMVAESIAKAAAIHASIEPTRRIINLIYSDGKVTVATDGRRLIQIDKGLGGTPENPKLFREDGKPLSKSEMEEAGKFPNWKQVVPSEENLFAAFKGLDIERLNNVLQQATQATSEKQKSVNLYRNPDGSIAVTSATPDLGDYQHNLQDGAKILGAYDPKYLVDAIKAAKILGNEKVDIWYTDDRAPVVIKATGMKVILMPMKVEGGVDEKNILARSDIEGKKPSKRKAEKPVEQPTAPAAAQPTEPTVEKLPWQMTQAEFVKQHKAIDAAWQLDKTKKSASSFGKFYGNDYQEYLDNGKFGKTYSELTYEQVKHRSEVKQALKEGKPVPAEVLADYPDLKPTTPPAEPPTGQAPLRSSFQKSGYEKTPEETNRNQRLLAKRLDESGQVLRTTQDEVNRLFSDARERNSRVLSQRKTSRLPGATGGGNLRPGPAQGTPGVFEKTRVFIEGPASGARDGGGRSVAGEDVLAARILFGTYQATGKPDETGLFIQKLFARLLNLKVVFRAMGEGENLALWTRDQDWGYDLIAINTTHLQRDNFNDPKVREFYDAQLIHELVHALANRVATKSELTSVWKSLSPDEQAKVQQVYRRNQLDEGGLTMDENQWGNEYIRMLFEERLFGKPSEFTDTSLSKETKNILRSAINYLKQIFGAKPTNNIAKEIIARLEGAIKGDAPIAQPVVDLTIEPPASLATNIEGAGNENFEGEKSSLSKGMEPGVAQDMESTRTGSGEILWATKGEIAQILLNPSERAGLVGGDSGSAQGTQRTPEKIRVLIEKPEASMPLSGVRQAAATLLANRIVSGLGSSEAKTETSEGHFFKLLVNKLTGLKFVIREFGPLPNGQPDITPAMYQADELGRFDVVSININQIGNIAESKELQALWDSMLIEEVIHAAASRLATRPEIEQVWNKLSDEERAKVNEFYDQEKTLDKPLDAFNGGHEYIRIILQERLTGRPTELSKFSISDVTKNILRRLLAELKSLFGAKPKNDFAREVIDRIEGAIKGEPPIPQPVVGLRDYAIEETAPTWYSRITRTVEQSPQNKASGSQWKAMIRNSKLGVSKDEYALVSVDDLEDGRTYTKAEVLDYLRANEVKVEDVTLGDRAALQNELDAPNTTRERADEIHKQLDRIATHFSTYQLPGGKEGSYREVLLTVPGAKTDSRYWRGLASVWRDGHSQYSDIANPIVRLRFNERTTADGKRMLFLEEVQAPQKGQFEKMPALFQKNWREIAFKWALRHAAENGFNQVGWTTGEMQAERYDLSKQVESIKAESVSDLDGVYFVDVYTTDRKSINLEVENGVVREGELEGKRLDEVIGKDMAEKILALEPGQEKIFKGGDLKVGGEGLKKLYDVDFRNVVNGLPVVKKSGQKVGVGIIETESKRDAWKAWDEKGNPIIYRDDNGASIYFPTEESARNAIRGTKGSMSHTLEAVSEADVHSITITPEMRDAVMAGQNMFSKASQSPAGWVEIEGNQPLTEADVRAAVDPILSNWHGVTFNLVNDPNWTSGEDSLIGGMRSGNEITLNLAAIGSKERAVALLLHEGVGHLGIRGTLGADFVRVMDEVWNMMTPENHAEVVKLVKRYGSDRTNLTAEWVARQAEKGATGSTWKRIWQRVMDWFAKVFGRQNAEAIARDLFRQGSKWLRTNPAERVDGQADYSIEEVIGQYQNIKGQVEAGVADESRLVDMERLVGEAAAGASVVKVRAIQERVANLKAIAGREIGDDPQANAETMAARATLRNRKFNDLFVEPLDNLERAVEIFGDKVKGFDEVMANGTERERNVALSEATDAARELRQKIQTFRNTNSGNQRRLIKRLADVMEKKQKFNQSDAAFFAFERDMVEIMRDGIKYAATKDEAAELGRIISDKTGTQALAKAMTWIENNIPTWNSFDTETDLAAAIKANPSSNTIGANPESVAGAIRLLLKFKGRYETSLANYRAAMQTTVAESDNYQKMLKRVVDLAQKGNINGALEVFRKGISESAVNRSRLEKAFNLLAKEETRIVAMVEQNNLISEMTDQMTADPEFITMMERLAAAANMRGDIVFGDSQGRTFLREIPGVTIGDVEIPMAATGADAYRAFDIINKYAEDAKLYLLNKGQRFYDPIVARSLENWLNGQYKMMADRSLLPENPHNQPGLAMDFMKSLFDVFGMNLSTVPQANLSYGAGLKAARTRVLLEAMSNARTGGAYVFKLFLPKLESKLNLALKAHGMREGNISDYQDEVISPLAASYSLYGVFKPKQVGDTLPSGQKVLQEDVDLMREINRYEHELFKVTSGHIDAAYAVPESLRQEARGIIEREFGMNGTMLRDQISKGQHMLSRHWWSIYKLLDDQRDNSWANIGNRAIQASRSAVIQAERAGLDRAQAERAGRRAYWKVAKEFETFINDNAKRILRGYAAGASEASFDFKYQFRDALREINNDISKGAEPVSTVNDLANRIADIEVRKYFERDNFDALGDEPPTVDEVKRQIISEVDQIMRRAKDYRETSITQAQKDNTRTVDVRGGPSSHTEARGQQVLPSLWYDYGSVGRSQWMGSLFNAQQELWITTRASLAQLIKETEARIEQLSDPKRNLTEMQTREMRKAGVEYQSADEARRALRHFQKLSTAFDRYDQAANELHTVESAGLNDLHRVIGRLATSGVLAGGRPMQNNWFGGLLMATFESVGQDIPVNLQIPILRLINGSKLGMFKGPLYATALGATHAKNLASKFSNSILRALTKLTGFKVGGKEIAMLQGLHNLFEAEFQKSNAQWEELSRLGLNNQVLLWETVKAMLDWSDRGGVAGEPNPNLRLSARTSRLEKAFRRSDLKALASIISETRGQMSVGFIDSPNNLLAVSMAMNMIHALQARAHAEMPGMVERATAGKYSWQDIADKRNYWTPKMLTGEEGGMAEKTAVLRREEMAKEGMSIEGLMTDYWKRYLSWVEAGKPAGQEPSFYATDAQRNSFIINIAKNINFGNFSTRPVAAHWNGAYEIIMKLLGYPLWGGQRIAMQFGSNLSNKSTQRFIPDRASAANVAMAIALVIALAMIGPVNQGLRDLYARYFMDYQQKALTPVYVAERLAAGQDVDPVLAGKILLSSMAGMIPIWGTPVNQVLDNASRNGYDLQQQLILVNIAKDMVGTIMQSYEEKDPYAALKFLTRWGAPDFTVKALGGLPFVNVLKGEQDNRNIRNLVVQGVKAADLEAPRSSSSGAAMRYTESSPFIRSWMAAMVAGDTEGRKQAWAGLVDQKRTELKANRPELDDATIEKMAEQNALGAVRSRNPFVGALGRMPSESEYEMILGKVTPENQEKIKQYMARYNAAISEDSGGTATVRSFTAPSGGSVTTFRAPAGGGGTGLGASGGGGRLPSGGGGGQTLSTGRVGSGMSLPSGVPSIGRAGLPRLGRFNVARRVAAAPRTRLPRLRLTRLKLPKLSARLKRPRLPRSGGRLLAMKKPRLRRTTLA